MIFVSAYARLILGFNGEELHAFVMDDEYVDFLMWLQWHRKDPNVTAAIRRLNNYVRMIAH